MRAVDPWVKVGAAFVAGALLTYLAGDALLRRRRALDDDDARLLGRVRMRVAELVSYPDAIDVQIDGGMVRVSGRILATELDRLLSQLTRVPRVFKVYNALATVDDASGLARHPGMLRGSEPAPA
jgi:hypothetical protein